MLFFFFSRLHVNPPEPVTFLSGRGPAAARAPHPARSPSIARLSHSVNSNVISTAPRTSPLHHALCPKSFRSCFFSTRVLPPGFSSPCRHFNNIFIHRQTSMVKLCHRSKPAAAHDFIEVSGSGHLTHALQLHIELSRVLSKIN